MPLNTLCGFDMFRALLMLLHTAAYQLTMIYGPSYPLVGR